MEIKTDAASHISILFVEDDYVILEIQSSVLAMKYPDVKLYTAVNGKLGLELFETYMPEIVITDINMSEMCGVKMAECIRLLKADTKLIALTGKDSDEINYTFDHVITKPVDLAELYVAVEQCVSEIKQRMS